MFGDRCQPIAGTPEGELTPEKITQAQVIGAIVTLGKCWRLRKRK